MKSLVIPLLSFGLLLGPVCPMAAMAAMQSGHPVGYQTNMSVAERVHAPEHACCTKHDPQQTVIAERKQLLDEFHVFKNVSHSSSALQYIQHSETKTAGNNLAELLTKPLKRRHTVKRE